jgi:2-polyprenyl-6-methoxyphenol hydroxylase-like FAD-dependent oxidoreductase
VYDVIIVGARVAGSSIAMLLARRGLKVLCLDRASFPSDTISTHQDQLPGSALLKRWGLLDRIIEAGTPAARRLRFDTGPIVLEGAYPAFEGVDAVFSPRRTILDKVLIDAARRAGAEVRERVVVEKVLASEGKVTGVQIRSHSGVTTTENAALIVGADGKHSLVAKSVGATTYNAQPPLTAAYYTYWQGVSLSGGEIYSRARRAIGVWPTNDSLVLTYVAVPADEFHAFRADIEGNFLCSLDLGGDIGERVRSGRRVERYYGSADLPNFFRKPYGPGWALTGDAGLAMDPVTGQGIALAFRDAELISAALEAGLGGRQPLDSALAAYEKERNRQTKPIFDFTTDLASFPAPRIEQEVLLRSIGGRQNEIDRFFGVLTGSTPMPEYFSPGNLLSLIGFSGFLKIAGRKFRERSGPTPEKEPAPIPVS